MVVYYLITPISIVGACFMVLTNTFLILGGVSQRKQKFKYANLLIATSVINILLISIPFFNPQGIDLISYILFFIGPFIVSIFTNGVVFILISTADLKGSRIWLLAVGCVWTTVRALYLLLIFDVLGHSIINIAIFNLIASILSLNGTILLILFGYYHREKFFTIAGAILLTWEIYFFIGMQIPELIDIIVNYPFF